jgi:spermidine synthase
LRFEILLFLVSASLFGFEIFVSMIMSFLFGPDYSFVVLGIAMIGFSVAGVYVFLRQSRQNVLTPDISDGTVGRLCLTLALSLVFNLFFISILSRYLSFHTGEILQSQGRDSAFAFIQRINVVAAPLIGLSIAVPFFIFALLANRIFLRFKDKIHLLYGFELIGGGAGCILAPILIDRGQYMLLPAVLCFLLVVLAGYFTSNLTKHSHPHPVLYWGIGTLVGAALLIAAPQLEPRPQLDVLARNYDLSSKVNELSHHWTTYSRVSALEISNPRRAKKVHVMALGNGEGHAYLTPYEPISPDDEKNHASTNDVVAVLATSINTPKNVLLLFAGAGRDMIEMDRQTNGTARITGVEINPKLFETALKTPGFHLAEFFSRPQIKMNISEARAFLENSQEKYDLIILSWSGATITYFTGAVGHTTQFMYTKEAIRTLLAHLTNQGMILVMNTNKINLLSSLREVFEEDGRSLVQNSVIVLFQPNTDTSNWRGGWDENRVLIKPAGFSPSEIKLVQQAGRSIDFEIAYQPFAPGATSWPYKDVLTNPDLASVLQRLRKDSGKFFGSSTDDRPYTFFVQPTGDIFNASTWRMVGIDILAGRYQNWSREIFIFTLSLFMLIFSFAPLLLKKTKGLPRGKTLFILFYFLSLGFGFMCVEVGMVHTLSLLLETTSLTTSVAVGGFVATTGLGSMLSRIWPTRPFMTAIISALLIAYLLSLIYFIHPQFVRTVLSWSLLARSLYGLGIILPAGILMGAFFPRGLIELGDQDKNIIPWAWAMNGIGGTVVGLAGPMISLSHGFSFLIQLGVGFYALIFFFSLLRNSFKGLTWR